MRASRSVVEHLRHLPDIIALDVDEELDIAAPERRPRSCGRRTLTGSASSGLSGRSLDQHARASSRFLSNADRFRREAESVLLACPACKQHVLESG